MHSNVSAAIKVSARGSSSEKVPLNIIKTETA